MDCCNPSGNVVLALSGILAAWCRRFCYVTDLRRNHRLQNLLEENSEGRQDYFPDLQHVDSQSFYLTIGEKVWLYLATLELIGIRIRTSIVYHEA